MAALKLMKLLRVTLHVRDQQEALHFYTKQLGVVKCADILYDQGQN
jgi:catechol-2,3-dioxygenase